MNPQYEFISNHREQIVQTQLNNLVHSRKAHRHGLPGNIFDKLGDALISSGSWLWKISRLPIDDNSVTIYSQN